MTHCFYCGFYWVFGFKLHVTFLVIPCWSKTPFTQLDICWIFFNRIFNQFETVTFNFISVWWFLFWFWIALLRVLGFYNNWIFHKPLDMSCSNKFLINSFIIEENTNNRKIVGQGNWLRFKCVGLVRYIFKRFWEEWKYFTWIKNCRTTQLQGVSRNKRAYNSAMQAYF